VVHWYYRTDCIVIYGQGSTAFTTAVVTASAAEKITQTDGPQPCVVVVVVQ
jgi:hypothetical protein